LSGGGQRRLFPVEFAAYMRRRAQCSAHVRNVTPVIAIKHEARRAGQGRAAAKRTLDAPKPGWKIQKTIVRFVPDDTELGQWIADGEALDNFSDEFRVVAQDVRVLFEDRRTDPRFYETGARNLEDERTTIPPPAFADDVIERLGMNVVEARTIVDASAGARVATGPPPIRTACDAIGGGKQVP
jgi:hypothetical protein